jgi:hypothetical protein
MIYAASAVRSIDQDLAGDLLRAFVADEDAGAGMGAKYLVDIGAEKLLHLRGPGEAPLLATSIPRAT